MSPILATETSNTFPPKTAANVQYTDHLITSKHQYAMEISDLVEKMFSKASLTSNSSVTAPNLWTTTVSMKYSYGKTSHNRTRTYP
jgi:hypothetical protein